MVPLRIVEVNGVNVNQENHKQVVARIKSIETETKLLGIVQKSAIYCNSCDFKDVAKSDTSRKNRQIYLPGRLGRVGSVGPDRSV